MHLYVELWKFRPAWLELSKEERKSWFEKLLGSLEAQLEAGVEPLGLARNDEDTPLSAGFDFVAVWKMPNQEIARQFENFVEAAGWHNYFEQVNVRGPMMGIDVFSSSHVDAENL
jgi:hypothetical protein